MTSRSAVPATAGGLRYYYMHKCGTRTKADISLGYLCAVVCCRFVRMWHCWSQNVGGRARRLGGLLVIVNLVVVVVILLLPKQAFLPVSLSLSPLSPVFSSNIAPVLSTPANISLFIHRNATWTTGSRLATFYAVSYTHLTLPTKRIV